MKIIELEIHTVSGALYGLYISANFPVDVVKKLPADITSGVYYGWACVDDGPVFKMVVSIGWNPYYKNTVKSVVSSYCGFDIIRKSHTFVDNFFKLQFT